MVLDEYHLDNILETIQKLSLGDFKARVDLNIDDENLNLIAIGLNMLAEELLEEN